MDPMEEQFREDCKKFSVGEMSKEQLEERFGLYEKHFGKEKFDEFFLAPPGGEVLNLAEAWAGFDDLKKIFDAEWQNVSSSLRLDNEVFIGKFLVARLKVEHVINQLLFEHFEVTEKETQKEIERLPFPVRLKLLPKKGRLYAGEIRLLYELNEVRNKLVHDLTFNVDEFMRTELSRHLGDKIKGELRQEVLLSILNNALFYLVLETKALKEKKEEVILGNPALMSLLGG